MACIRGKNSSQKMQYGAYGNMGRGSRAVWAMAKYKNHFSKSGFPLLGLGPCVNDVKRDYILKKVSWVSPWVTKMITFSKMLVWAPIKHRAQWWWWWWWSIYCSSSRWRLWATEMGRGPPPACRPSSRGLAFRPPGPGGAAVMEARSRSCQGPG